MKREVCQLGEITKITVQKKSSNRYNIYIDHTFAFGVDEDVFVKYQLHKGKILSDETIEKIKNADDFHRSYSLALNYLSYRMRSEKEVRQYLRKKEVLDETIEEIIAKLHKEKLLNDLEFAKMFVSDRIKYSHKGPRFIQKELLEKGVLEDKIERALEQYDEATQLKKLNKWLDKQLKKKSKYSYRKRIEQLKVKLLQLGFTQHIIEAAFSEKTFEQNESEEKELLTKQADKLYNKYRRKYNGTELILKLKQRLFQQGFDSDLIQSYIDDLEQ